MKSDKKSLVSEKKEVLILDLTNENKPINESFLRIFGYFLRSVLGKIFGLNNIDFKIRGEKSKVESFVKAVSREASYMKAVEKHGLKNPTTYKNKSKLNSAIKSFEKETGIQWPFYWFFGGNEVKYKKNKLKIIVKEEKSSPRHKLDEIGFPMPDWDFGAMAKKEIKKFFIKVQKEVEKLIKDSSTFNFYKKSELEIMKVIVEELTDSHKKGSKGFLEIKPKVHKILNGVAASEFSGSGITFRPLSNELKRQINLIDKEIRRRYSKYGTKEYTGDLPKLKPIKDRDAVTYTTHDIKNGKVAKAMSRWSSNFISTIASTIGYEPNPLDWISEREEEIEILPNEFEDGEDTRAEEAQDINIRSESDLESLILNSPDPEDFSGIIQPAFLYVYDFVDDDAGDSLDAYLFLVSDINSKFKKIPDNQREDSLMEVKNLPIQGNYETYKLRLETIYRRVEKKQIPFKTGWEAFLRTVNNILRQFLKTQAPLTENIMPIDTTYSDIFDKKNKKLYDALVKKVSKS